MNSRKEPYIGPHSLCRPIGTLSPEIHKSYFSHWWMIYGGLNFFFRNCESQLIPYKRIDNSSVFLAKHWKIVHFCSSKVCDSTPCFQCKMKKLL